MLFIAQLQAERLAGTLTAPPAAPATAGTADSADRPVDPSGAGSHEDARAAS